MKLSNRSKIVFALIAFLGLSICPSFAGETSVVATKMETLFADCFLEKDDSRIYLDFSSHYELPQYVTVEVLGPNLEILDVKLVKTHGDKQWKSMQVANASDVKHIRLYHKNQLLAQSQYPQF
jgi:hypothetical protein